MKERPGPDRSPARPRILIVAPQPFYTDRGTPITTRYLIEALHELGYGVDVLTYPLGEALDIPGVELTRIPNPLGLSRVPIGFSWRKCWLDLFLFQGLARCLSEREYACVSALEESAFVAALVAPRFGVPVLYDMQSSLAEQLGYLGPLRNGVAQRLLDACERWLFDRVDLTMTSAGLARRVRNAMPSAAVREWQYPGMGGPSDESEIAELRESLGLEAGAPVVLYAGNFAEYQGLAELLAAMPSVLAAVPEAVLVMVGDGSDHELEEMLRSAGHLPEDSVRVLPRQPREAMPTYFGLADVVVSPRQFGENLPLKVLDYMSAGAAMMATDIPAHQTVLDEETAVLVGTSVDALASGIIELLRDAELRDRLGRRAREVAEEKLGWIRYVRSVGEAYAAVCENGRER